MSTGMTDEQTRVAERVAKLLALADKNPNPAEAAAAANKAQRMLEDYNLTASQVEQASGDTGKREMMMVTGGAYEYHRALWRTVAELNFCAYVSRYVWLEKKTAGVWRKNKHQLIGRVVNVRSAIALGTYLQAAVERQLMERLGGDVMQCHSRWAYSFREGAFDDIVRRLADQRHQRLQEEAAEQERRAKAGGGSTATGLTLAGLEDREKDANYDFVHGEGASAKRRARRAQQAAEAAEAERQHAEWAAANPEEARKQAEKERKENERYWARRRGGRYSTGKADKTDWGAYEAGRSVGKNISLNQQADTTTVAGRLT